MRITFAWPLKQTPPPCTSIGKSCTWINTIMWLLQSFIIQFSSRQSSKFSGRDCHSWAMLHSQLWSYPLSLHEASVQYYIILYYYYYTISHNILYCFMFYSQTETFYYTRYTYFSFWGKIYQLWLTSDLHCVICCSVTQETVHPLSSKCRHIVIKLCILARIDRNE